MVITMSTIFSANGSPPNVLVTGGNGFLGSHLVEALVGKGYQVRCLVRKTSDLRWIEGIKADFFYGDLSNLKSLYEAVGEVDYVYHLAGVTKAIRPQFYYKANRDGTKNLLKVCSENRGRLKKFVYVSSLAAAGPSLDGTPIKEADPPRPITDYGRSKLEGEQEVWRHKDMFPVTTIRPPVIYGPRDRQLLSFFQIVKKGIIPVLEMKLSLAYVKDVVEGLILAGEGEGSEGKVYFVSSPGVPSWQEMGDVASQIMGLKGMRLRLPSIFPFAVACFCQAISFISRKPATLSLQKAREMREKYWICDWAKAREELGFNPTYPLRKGLAETIEWYKRQGWI
jgi:dihydroflavonol-4-reductase